MATRRELVQAIHERYRSAWRNEKRKILDEFVAVTGYHHKHAIRVLKESFNPLRGIATPPADLRRGGPRRAGHALGSGAAGSFIGTLVLTDIATGWTECVPLVVREPTLLIEAVSLGSRRPAAMEPRHRWM